MGLKLLSYVIKNRGHHAILKVKLVFSVFCWLIFAILSLPSPVSKVICTCFCGALWDIQNSDKYTKKKVVHFFNGYLPWEAWIFFRKVALIKVTRVTLKGYLEREIYVIFVVHCKWDLTRTP